MPNINEFLNPPERIFSPELEKIGGAKPCSKCDKDSSEYFWMHISIYFKGIGAYLCPIIFV